MPSSNPIRAPRQYGTPDTISRRTSSPSRFFSPSRFLLAKIGARNRLRECARSPPRSLGLACPCPPSIGQLQPRAQRMHNATQLQSSFEFGAQWIVINNRYNNRKSCRASERARTRPTQPQSKHFWVAVQVGRLQTAQKRAALHWQG